MTEQNLARAPEAKSAGGHPELADAFDEFMTTFETFKDSNDRRLAELETRGADVLTVEKVDRISRALDEQKRAIDNLSLKRMRPALENGRRALPSEHKQAFDAYMRSGDERAIRSLDSKAMSYGSGPDGGYLVPNETETEIGKRLAELSPIRSIATVRQVSGAVLKKPFSVAGPAVGWVAETASRTQTTTATLAELSFPTTELYAMPAATASLLEDTVVDLDQWIASEVEAAFAEQERARNGCLMACGGISGRSRVKTLSGLSAAVERLGGPCQLALRPLAERQAGQPDRRGNDQRDPRGSRFAGGGSG